MAEIKFLDLNADNAFDFCGVLDAVGLESVASAIDKNEILALQKSGKDKKAIGMVIAMKVLGIIIKKLSGAREPIYSFFAGCTVWENGTSVSVDDLRKLKLSTFLKLMKDFFQKDDLGDFFKEVAELLNVEQVDLKNC